ncbi:MAG: hypothetical protein COU35_01955 [Candidatus Magasanikbacteria bacterium CG10_big_fil_rev_8_21_14_0_10_47_10]|uniref:HTH cro/C1-type domain-containing protein n=1 Tax=Candidatus Magasanikbacteria bacterium CG10_big_fil_rev_8_21_14_0_10_47_10 TaxID=1974652 RepID=A0A2H0TQU8_9BACT|nr:MAG: hypothetical protein COU35_01955 [Candidatus Magasanikbacteria bacterium CG10_big_fil_rev_8_21_14_0_10_47_10]
MKLMTKQLNPTKRVCLRLQEAREHSGVSLQELSKRMRLSQDHIVALEECRFDEIPFAPVYQKNIIKSYMTNLGLDPDSFVDQFVCEEANRMEETPTRGRKKQQGFDSTHVPLLLKLSGISVVVISILGYLMIQVRHIVEPPNLVIYSPTDGLITHEQVIVVHGKTDSEASIQINGQRIPNSESGFFEQSIPLNEGVNTIMFMAQKKHGKQTLHTSHIIYKKDSSISALPFAAPL